MHAQFPRYLRVATTRPSSLIVCTALRKAWCCPRAGGLQIRLLSCRLLGPLLDRKFHVGGQVAGSPAPFYLTRQQAHRGHQQQGGSSFSWLRVLRKIVAHGPPLYFLQLPSLVVALLSWLHLCGCIPSYKMVTGWGGLQQLFTLFVVQATTTTSDGASMHACISSRRFQASSFA